MSESVLDDPIESKVNQPGIECRISVDAEQSCGAHTVRSGKAPAFMPSMHMPMRKK
jgi:hypothetical protein